MWRYQMAVKGSEQELRWLNQQAQRGQVLRRIRGNWYQFQKTATRYQVFSEYVSGNVATEIDDQHTPFELLTRLQLTKPAVQVIYTGTAQTELQGGASGSSGRTVAVENCTGATGTLVKCYEY
ncbi:hypothetical protein [Lactiplantibacillus plantarum]|uniref:hypothetical protein n=1 Tax=Lactiplantibacillus plantarum TaxID=1590 RepID=UPI000ACDA66D|nr:hypothetical protein [Lactiplantibacillus plantarum]MCG0771000.1 hypothetical protein [Lactiplantibacillus plantarum]MDT4760577.1 hypothetical protein [Lactiplantibacillus plantarum]MDY7130635.1 hypothetical protein [Lactiplantibacillus plantarum]